MSDDHRKQFWDRLESIRTGMLEIDGRFLPMSHNLAPEDGNIWFITAQGTAMADAAAAGETARYVISGDGNGLYASINGGLEISNDPERLEQVWNFIASSWFEDGKRDDDLVLIRYRPANAEVWLTGKSGLGFLYQVAKAHVTGDKPDMGVHTLLTF
ncbi:MAG: pyridoxamine 5'-phosphate oxidase family protein [Paracoccus sp. (in: a-proteobacteria)]|nr:pyridoxamine 5'-phosphate oxidase family protein [Paracoccus sp. (in: a-proteobacteria)]